MELAPDGACWTSATLPLQSKYTRQVSMLKSYSAPLRTGSYCLLPEGAICKTSRVLRRQNSVVLQPEGVHVSRYPPNDMERMS